MKLHDLRNRRCGKEVTLLRSNYFRAKFAIEDIPDGILRAIIEIATPENQISSISVHQDEIMIYLDDMKRKKENLPEQLRKYYYYGKDNKGYFRINPLHEVELKGEITDAITFEMKRKQVVIFLKQAFSREYLECIFGQALILYQQNYIVVNEKFFE